MLSTRLNRAGGLILGALVPIMVTAAPSKARPSRDYVGLDLGMISSSYSSPALKTLLFGPAVNVTYAHQFSLFVDARVDGGAEVLTGAATGVMPSDMMGQQGPRQALRLREASIDLHTRTRAMNASVGAINQKRFDNPLLAGDMSFLGVVAQIQGDTVVGETALTAETAVPPTSFSLLETASTGQTPTYSHVQVAHQIGAAQDSFARFTVGYFAFDHLTTAQARQSLFWGNSITGNTNSAAFYLPYRGLEAGVRGAVRMNARWRALAAGNFVQNVAAPRGAGLGYLGTLGAGYALDHAQVSLSAGYLYDQSDSSPAVFTEGFLSGKNHRGAILNLEYEAGGYAVFARALSTRPLVPQLYAGETFAALIGIRVHYDFL